jgi:hypothetical protein
MSDTPTEEEIEQTDRKLANVMVEDARRIMNEVCKEYLDNVVNNQLEILAYARGFRRNINSLQERNNRLQKRIITLEAEVWNLQKHAQLR